MKSFFKFLGIIASALSIVGFYTGGMFFGFFEFSLSYMTLLLLAGCTTLFLGFGVFYEITSPAVVSIDKREEVAPSSVVQKRKTVRRKKEQAI